MASLAELNGNGNEAIMDSRYWEFREKTGVTPQMEESLKCARIIIAPSSFERLFGE